MGNERDFDTLSDNLSLIDKWKKNLSKVLAGQYREALIAFSESDHRDTFASPPEEAAWLFRRLNGSSPMCSEDFALFCLAYGDHFGQTTPVNTFSTHEEQDLSSSEKALFMRNPYGDRAFRHFSSLNKGMKSVYSQSYSSACEEVYNGRGSYVILPIHNIKDGSLTTFRRMLRKYDLKITAACSVETDDGDYILYGLAQKFLRSDVGNYVDMSVVFPEGTSLTEFLTCCEILGLQLRYINSVPLEYASDTLAKHEIHVCFDCRQANPGIFALFLDASHIRYEIEGIYNIINE